MSWAAIGSALASIFSSAGAAAAPAAAGAGTAAGAGLGAGTAVTGAGLGSGAIGTGMTATQMAGGLGASGLSVAPGGGLALGGAGGMAAAPMAAKASGMGSLFSNMSPGRMLGGNLGRMGANTSIGDSLLSPIVTKINETPFLTGNGSGGILGGSITTQGMGEGIGKMAGGFAENSLGKLLGGKPAPPIQAPAPPPITAQPMGAAMGTPQMEMPGFVSTTGGGQQDVLAKLRALGLLR